MRSKATDCQRCHGRSRHQAGECQSRNIPKYLPMSSDLNKKGPSNWQHTREETFYSSKHLPEQSGKEYQGALDSPKGKNFVIWSHFHHLSTSGAGVSEKTLCRHESWSTRALGELLMTLVNWRFKKRNTWSNPNFVSKSEGTPVNWRENGVLLRFPRALGNLTLSGEEYTAMSTHSPTYLRFMNSTFLHLILVSSNYYHRLQLQILPSSSSADLDPQKCRNCGRFVPALLFLARLYPWSTCHSQFLNFEPVSHFPTFLPDLGGGSDRPFPGKLICWNILANLLTLLISTSSNIPKRRWGTMMGDKKW